MTDYERRKVQQALEETRTAQKRAMRYSPEFRDQELCAFYVRHIAKLEGYLATDRMPDVFERS
jgi:hypothetical protein